MHHISGSTNTSATVIIIPEHWEILAKGDGHIILSNNQNQDKLYNFVLSVCRHQIQSLPQAFDVAYHRILKSVQGLQQYLLVRQEINFSNNEKTVFSSMLQKLCGNEIGNFKVFLSENLIRGSKQWDFYLQFKPKTPIPQIYSFDFLEGFCQKHELRVDNLMELLKESPSVEKTRWFKKNALKEKKHNMNSLQIFSMRGQNVPNYSDYLKPFNVQINKLHSLDSSVIHQCLKNTKIFDKILKIQLLHTADNNFGTITEENLMAVSQNELEIQKCLIKMMDELNKQVDYSDILENLYRQSPLGPKKGSKKASFESILRFLVSWSWRDVSLILRLRLSPNKSSIEQGDLKIIDYELKQAKKLTTTLKKDETFLTNYLKFKNFL